MNKEDILHKRFIELANICCYKNIPVFSDFLDLNEQTIFLGCIKELPLVNYRLDGGFDTAERKIVCFIPIDMENYSIPVRVIKVEPVNSKYAEKCSHRDYLGSVMNLGLDRSKFGDFVVSDDICYILCMDNIFEYVCDNLITVKHTRVQCSEAEIADVTAGIKYDIISGTVASVRLDSVLSIAFRESREHMKNYINAEKVFVNGKCITRPDFALKEGDIVSARGLGKFLFVSTGNETRKGRLYIKVKKYI